MTELLLEVDAVFDEIMVVMRDGEMLGVLDAFEAISQSAKTIHKSHDHAPLCPMAIGAGEAVTAALTAELSADDDPEPVGASLYRSPWTEVARRCEALAKSSL